MLMPKSCSHGRCCWPQDGVEHRLSRGWSSGCCWQTDIVSLSLLPRFSTSSHSRLSSTSTSSSSWPTTTSPIASAPSCWTMSLSAWKLVGCWTRGEQGAWVWRRWRRAKASPPSMAHRKGPGAAGCGSTWTSSTGSRPSSQTSCSALTTRSKWVVFWLAWGGGGGGKKGVSMLCTRPVLFRSGCVLVTLCPSPIVHQSDCSSPIVSQFHCVLILLCPSSIVVYFICTPGPLWSSPFAHQAHCDPVLCPSFVTSQSHGVPIPLCPVPLCPVPLCPCPIVSQCQACG